MAAGSGLVVANNYYNQPLLGKIADSFHISEAKASSVAVLTQVGYAVGLLFIIPLGDMVRRKRLILTDFVLILFSLLMAAMAPNIHILMVASFLIGLTSVIPQLFVPMAAHLAKPEDRGKAIGTVMSGLLIGILCSRTLSGIVGEYFGWRAMFFIAAGVMVVLWIALLWLLPEVHPDYKGSYKELMMSLVKYIKTEPSLRLASIRGGLGFAGFGAFWTTLVFLLQEPPFNAGSDVAGAFGLIGAGGALAASVVGRISDRMNKRRLITITTSMMLVAWIVFGFSAQSMAGLIIGVILLDLGLQSTHIANQTIIFALHPAARNRLNTVYMVSYFIGGATGTFVAGQAWHLWKWDGVVGVGLVVSGLTLLIHLLGGSDQVES
ncbi:MFS transporter [Arcticibacter tournemirensis]|uniref:MFS transporter n=2 Tax=Arcticibacter tournemirensis TaxID=699437 RepID=A0A5M9GZ49_9SPHI|nr:MFS transporter [Arcticibacter tournemirensis]